jgi:ribosome modulation factor
MNRALLGAMRKGIAAKAAGEPRSSCPYHDVRKLDGRLTWGRAFRKAWFDGYDGTLTDADKRALQAWEAVQELHKLGRFKSCPHCGGPVPAR